VTVSPHHTSTNAGEGNQWGARETAPRPEDRAPTEEVAGGKLLPDGSGEEEQRYPFDFVQDRLLPFPMPLPPANERPAWV